MVNQDFFCKLYAIYGISVAAYQEYKLQFQIPSMEIPQEVAQLKKEWITSIEKAIYHPARPAIFMENEYLYYGAIPVADNQLILLGPVANRNMSKENLLKFQYAHKLKHSVEIPFITAMDFVKLLCLLCNGINGMDVLPQDISIGNSDENIIAWNIEPEIEKYEMNQSEEEWDHQGMEMENRVIEIVTSGDIEAMKKMVSGVEVLPQDTQHEGKVAVDDIKKAEYMTVGMITVLTRAASSGGMNPEKAHALGDIYLQRLEKCKSATEMLSLAARAQYEFTLGVKNAREENSRVIYIEQCKDYIARNLRKPMKVGDIAPAIGVNRSYLTRRFSEVEGITIQQYIMKERCSHAANLLKYSDYPISIISEYFCFSSQSHFGRQFREFYHMTPKDYRNQNRLISSNGGVELQ